MREVARCQGIQQERHYIAMRRPQIWEQLWQPCSHAALPFLYLQAVFAIVAGFWTLRRARCFSLTGVCLGMWLPKCRTLAPIWGFIRFAQNCMYYLASRVYSQTLLCSAANPDLS